MFSWLNSFWVNQNFPGPARHAPNNGYNIRALLEQRPQCIVVVTEKEIKDTLSSLKKTKINAIPPLSNKNPLMKEFDGVCEIGFKEYFERRKQKITKESKEEILEEDDDYVIID